MSEKKTGRPSDYKPEYDEQAFRYSLLGATDKEMANFFDITEKTLNTWKEVHSSFLQSIKDGKDDADARVVKSLYKRATGYNQIVQKPMVVSLGSGAGSEVEIVEYEEKIAPDTAAAFIWLKNRQAKKWRDKQPEAAEDNPGQGDSTLIAQLLANPIQASPE